MIDALRRANPGLTLMRVADLEATGLGRAVAPPGTTGWQRVAAGLPKPTDRVVYEPSHPDLDALAATSWTGREVFGGLGVQSGYCHGHNLGLGAFEHHVTSEVVYAATPLLLLLDHARRIRNGRLSPDTVVGALLDAGEAVELYARTLHFAPISVTPEGFRSIIVLPTGTNLPLPAAEREATSDPTLFAVNKWVVAHVDSPIATRGAHVGLVGEMLRVALPDESDADGR